MADPLQALLVDETEIAREELASGLSPFVRLTSSGALVLEPSFEALGARQKVLCALLALKALHLLELREKPTAGPAEISSASGIPSGTVKPRLRELASDRLVIADGGRYEIPNHALRRVLDEITRDD